MVEEVIKQLAALANGLEREIQTARESSDELRANGDAVEAFQSEVSAIRARRLQRAIQELVKRHSDHSLVPETTGGKVYVRGVIATH